MAENAYAVFEIGGYMAFTCPHCTAIVGNLNAHEAWHLKLENKNASN